MFYLRSGRIQCGPFGSRWYECVLLSKVFCAERRIAGWFQNHDCAVYMHDRHTGHGAEGNTERVCLRRDHVAVLIRLANDGGDAFVPWYRFFVVAFTPLERLCEVDRGLV